VNGLADPMLAASQSARAPLPCRAVADLDTILANCRY
jgi:hypothetical protein